MDWSRGMCTNVIVASFMSPPGEILGGLCRSRGLKHTVESHLPCCGPLGAEDSDMLSAARNYNILAKAV